MESEGERERRDGVERRGRERARERGETALSVEGERGREREEGRRWASRARDTERWCRGRRERESEAIRAPHASSKDKAIG